MKKQINTLAELELEQEKLKMTMELTRQEFARNLGTNRKQIKNFLLKNVALPVGAVGVGIAAVNKMSNNKKENTSNSSNNSINDFWKMMIPFGLNLLQSYFLKKQNEKIENITEEPKNKFGLTVEHRTVA